MRTVLFGRFKLDPIAFLIGNDGIIWAMKTLILFVASYLDVYQ